MIGKKLGIGVTLVFTITSVTVLVSSLSGEPLLIKKANAEGVSYNVTFDANNGALLEDANSITSVEAKTSSSSGEYPLYLEYSNGTSLNNGLVTLFNDGYVALTSKITNISSISVVGSGNGTLSFGSTQSYGYTDNFAVGVHYAEGANYFEIRANGTLQISSITVTYGCLSYDYETFSILGTGGITSVVNHGFTDSRTQLSEFYDGRLNLTTTAFKINYTAGLHEISSSSMNILKYSSDKTSVERIVPTFFNIDFFYGKLFFEFDTSSFNEGDILVLHKGSNFVTTVSNEDHYFMLENDYEVTYSPLKNRLRSDDVNFTYSIEGDTRNNESAVFDGSIAIDGNDTSKRWTNYNSTQLSETCWTFNFENPVSVKTINLHHFIDGSLSRLPETFTVTVVSGEESYVYSVTKNIKSISDFDNCIFLTNYSYKTGNTIMLTGILPSIINNVNSTSVGNYYKVSTNAAPKSEFYFKNEIENVSSVSIATVSGIKAGTTPVNYCTGYYEIEILGK